MTLIHVSREFSYDITRLDESTVYSVYYGGKPPSSGGGANGIPLGTLIGRIHHVPVEGIWHATPDDGTWADARWFSPFFSRREAAMFLVGMLYERMNFPRP